MPDRYYSFKKQIDNRTSAKFIILDTEGFIREIDFLVDTSLVYRIPQYVWLKSELAKSKEEWLIVVGHHPVFSASPTHGDTWQMISFVKPLFDRYGVDFYFSGHDHHLEHAREPGRNIDYIISGAGGDTRPVERNQRTAFSADLLGFAYVSLSHDRAKVYFITDEGKLVYTYLKKTRR